MDVPLSKKSKDETEGKECVSIQVYKYARDHVCSRHSVVTSCVISPPLLELYYIA